MAWPPPAGAFPHAMWAPPQPPGAATHAALSRIRGSIQLYWYTLLASFLSALVAGVTLGVSSGGTFGALASSESAGAAARPLVNGGGIAASLLLSLLGLLVLIVSIIAWLRWREGATNLMRDAYEFGPAASSIAQRVREDVSRTTYMFLATFVAGIVFVIAIVILVFSAVVGSLNRTGPAPGAMANANLAASLIQEIALASVVFALVVTLFQVLMYAFATRSHVDSLAPYAPPEARRLADSGRVVVLLGAILAPVGVLGFFVPYAGLVAIVPPLLLIFGYREIRRSFDLVLANPLAYRPGSKPVDRLLF